MTFKAMCFKDRINGNIVWADIQLITVPGEDGKPIRIARPIAIEIPKLLPMAAFLTTFQKGIIEAKILDKVNWEKLQLIEVQLKSKSLIHTIN